MKLRDAPKNIDKQKNNTANRVSRDFSEIIFSSDVIYKYDL